MQNFNKNILGWVLVVLAAVSIYGMLNPQNQSTSNELTYSEFLSLIDSGTIQSVTMQGNQLQAKQEDGTTLHALAPYDPDLVSELRKKGVNIQVEEAASNSTLLTVLISWLPWLLFIGIWVYFMRQMQGGGGGKGSNNPFSFGKSRANLMTEGQVRITFDDVAGVDEAKQELSEIVEYLRDPRKFQRLGGKIPKGVLLVGPPGTGKTLLARSVAGEAKVPFFSISGSDFVEMFVGVGAARVRDLFEQGKRNAPCIIFIDEIDAVGRHRGTGMGGGNDEREQTLNQMLVEMDGFESNEGIILVAATNRPDVLDPALLRPGRFDRQVMVPLPDISGRERILNVHIQKVPVAANVDVKTLARGTPGFSGADLANLVNEAALMGARKNKRLVDMHDFEEAKDKVMMGAERRSTVMTEEQKKTTAYHEAGHAILNLFLDGPLDPLHKVTIIPRGQALGVTMSLPEEDKFTQDKKYLENQIALLAGGRLAEEIFLDQHTTGASNDIERATDIARHMVKNWGMSEKLGFQSFDDERSQPFLGRSMAAGAGSSSVSAETAKVIDAEVTDIIDRNYKRAETLIKKKKKELEALAKALLEHETLDKSQIDDLMAGKKITPKKEPRRASSAQKKKSSPKKK